MVQEEQREWMKQDKQDEIVDHEEQKEWINQEEQE